MAERVIGDMHPDAEGLDRGGFERGLEPQPSARYSRHRRAIVGEGIACAAAGACIIHVHAYDGGGPQTFDWQVYARIIEGIRARSTSRCIPRFRRPGSV